METIKEVAKTVFKSLLTKILLSAFGLVAGVFLLIIILVAIIIAGQDDEDHDFSIGRGKLSETVLQWEDDITASAEENGLDKKYVPIMLAILQQESGGDAKATKGDIFQSSESKCGSIGCITDPRESIDTAVKYFKGLLDEANGEMKVAIQAYNFGGGFISYAKRNNNGKYSQDIAIEFSVEQMAKVSNPSNYTCIRKEAKKHGACYGDILYVPSILEYVELQKGESKPSKNVGKNEFGLPLNNPNVTSEFGNRFHPIHKTKKLHAGIDLGCINAVTPIFASADGEVVYSGVSGSMSTGYGNIVMIKHNNGYITAYAHLFSRGVDVGDNVKKGDQIGKCGTTGGSTGPHLHFEIKKDLWSGHENPRNYVNF